MLKSSNLRLSILALTLTCLVTLPVTLTAEDGGEVEPNQAAFEKLKMLEGTWKGPSSNPEEPQVHIFEVSAAGTVVKETMAPGSAHEMINMYHLDGDHLMLTHYCAGGNQPRMRMVDGDLSKVLTFEFFDGTNLDSAKDGHIHSGKIVFVDGDSIESQWAAFNGGEQVGEMIFQLTRVSD